MVIGRYGSLVVICWLFGTLGLFSQEITNVNSSIKIIGGEAFYVHTVLEGQSLDAITQAYFSTTPQVLNANVGVSMHPPAGTTIRIPYTDASAEAMSKGAAVVKKKEPVMVLQDGTVKGTPPKVVASAPTTPLTSPPPPEPAKPAIVAASPPVDVVVENSTSESLAEKVNVVEPTPEPAMASDPEPEHQVSEEERPMPEVEQPSEVVEENLEQDFVLESTPEVPELSEPEQTTAIEPAPAEKEVELTPLAEAALLLEQEMTEEMASPDTITDTAVATPEAISEATPLATETTELMNDLGALSKDINESLANLAKLKESLETTSAEAQPEVGRTAEDFSAFFTKLYTNFFNAKSDSADAPKEFFMREYFMVHTDNRNRIRRIADERTQTNRNSMFCNPEDLRGLQISDNAMQRNFSDPLAIGLEMVMIRYEYELNIKKSKVRVYRQPMFVEYLPEEHPHTILLREISENRGERGRCHAVIYDGEWNVGTYSPFEYNPFGKKEETLSTAHILKLESIEFK